MKQYLITSSAIAFLFLTALLPSVTTAQTKPLVACTGVNCNFCSAVETLDRVIDFLFVILVLVAVILVVVAGLRLVTSGGDVSAMEKAKSMLTNAIIGVVIVMSAWLIVDTVMKTLIKNDDYDPGSWYQLGGIDCNKGIKNKSTELNNSVNTQQGNTDLQGTGNYNVNGGAAVPAGGQNSYSDFIKNTIPQLQQ